MGERKRRLLWVVVVLLLISIAGVQTLIEPIYQRIQDAGKSKGGAKESQALMVQLPAQFVLASVTGFKEVIAGALWVRADSFFHSGQFEQIIPLVRLVTWFDPHNIDVYTTGAWHLDYNFVDRWEMSDKRYIPASIALLNEGVQNNPNIWDLYFELGWTHYSRKANDQYKALEALKLACQKDGLDANTGQRTPRPEYVDRMLAHQYEKLGRFEDAIAQWGKCRKRAIEAIQDAKKHGYEQADSSSLDICDRNLAFLYLRVAWRYGNMDYYRKGLEIVQRFAARENAPADLVKAANGAAADYAKRLAANNPPADAKKPLDLGFQVSFKKLAPKIFCISGKVNLAKASEYKGLASESFTYWYANDQKKDAERRELWRDGCRVNWMLADYDYKKQELNTFSWDIDKKKLIAWDSVYVGGGSFSSGKIDMSVNPLMYPFKAKKYKLTVWLTPMEPNCPDFVQDRVGWKGEAFYDKNYLDTKMLPGFKCVKWEKVLNREDLI